jgi:hypothetical protein
MESEIVLALIDKKIQLLNAIANTSMLWWVSATVFCATLLGGIWRFHDQIESAPFRRPLGYLLYFFLISVVLYGCLVTVVTAFEWRDVQRLLDSLGANRSLFNTEFAWILIGVPVGTSSFVIILLVWHGMWRSMNRPAAASVSRQPVQGATAAGA